MPITGRFIELRAASERRERSRWGASPFRGITSPALDGFVKLAGVYAGAMISIASRGRAGSEELVRICSVFRMGRCNSVGEVLSKMSFAEIVLGDAMSIVVSEITSLVFSMSVKSY